MLTAFLRAFRTPDLRRKLLFTLFIIAVFRLGSTLPCPGVSVKAVNSAINTVNSGASANIYQLVNLFSGGALLKLTVFALGIMPYITASIIMQLLAVVIPRLETLQDEGQSGTAKITQYTRYLTVGLAILQSTGIVALARSGRLFSGFSRSLLVNDSVFTVVTMVITMTAGTAVIMWLGELITDRGVGNGISLLIFTQVIAVFPSELGSVYQSKGAFALTIVVLVGVAIIGFIVFMEQAQRRIPVQYAKRMVGRRMYGGTSTYIPMKVNQAGVIPVIFASSLLYIPQLLSSLFGNTTHPQGWVTWIDTHFVQQNSAFYITVVLRADRVLHLLLRVDHVQPDEGRGQHEEVRRLHPRHQTRPAHGRVPPVRAVQAHRPRLAVPGIRGPHPHDRVYVRGRGQHDPVRRNHDPHRCRRRPGHRETDRKPAPAAQLRGLP